MTGPQKKDFLFPVFFKKQRAKRVIKKKILPAYFKLIKQGKKKFELRLADFKLKTGDIFIMEEWDPKKRQYTGQKMKKKVKYILKFNLDTFGQKEEIIKKGLYVIQF